MQIEMWSHQVIQFEEKLGLEIWFGIHHIPKFKKKKKKTCDPMESPSVMCELEISPAGSEICLELLQK